GGNVSGKRDHQKQTGIYPPRRENLSDSAFFAKAHRTGTPEKPNQLRTRIHHRIMEVKFTSELGDLDLSEIKISMQESNSKISDQKFSKFMFPFEIMASQEFIKNYGDYVSYETTGLQNMIPGFLSLEGKVHEAKL